MKARVKSSSPLPIVRSAGLYWDAKEWREVPPNSEAEILANPYLETDSGTGEISSTSSSKPEKPTNVPAAESLAEQAVEPEEPSGVEDKAARLVEPAKNRRGYTKGKKA